MIEAVIAAAAPKAVEAASGVLSQALQNPAATSELINSYTTGFERVLSTPARAFATAVGAPFAGVAKVISSARGESGDPSAESDRSVAGYVLVGVTVIAVLAVLGAVFYFTVVQPSRLVRNVFDRFRGAADEVSRVTKPTRDAARNTGRVGAAGTDALADAAEDAAATLNRTRDAAGNAVSDFLQSVGIRF